MGEVLNEVETMCRNKREDRVNTDAVMFPWTSTDIPASPFQKFLRTVSVQISADQECHCTAKIDIVFGL